MKKLKQSTIKLLPIAFLAFFQTAVNAQCVLKANLNSTPVTCNGSCDGTASITNLDPGTNYLFQWSNGSTAQSLTGLCAGQYAVTIDQDKCIFNLSITIGTPDPLVASCVSSVPDAPGTITASVSGGTTPYSFSWNTVPVQTGNVAANLPAGTYTATVTDANGCTAVTSCTINEPKEECRARTQTMGGWGAVPQGNNPGTYLHSHFAASFPNGLSVGCNNHLVLTNAQAVTDFLPSGSTAKALPSGSLVNPGGNYANVLAGQVVALTLSVVFDSNDPNFGLSNISLGDHVIANGVFYGWTVNALLAEANKKLGGCFSPYSFSTLNNALTKVNENYVGGSVDKGFLICEEKKRTSFDPAQLNNSFSGLTLFPNPAENIVNLKFTLLENDQVSINIFDISGRMIYNENINAKAGVTNSQIDINNMLPGIYVVKLQSSNNTLLERIVKK